MRSSDPYAAVAFGCVVPTATQDDAEGWDLGHRLAWALAGPEDAIVLYVKSTLTEAYERGYVLLGPQTLAPPLAILQGFLEREGLSYSAIGWYLFWTLDDHP